METNTQKIPGKVIAAYCFQGLAYNSLWYLNSYFLLYFYTDVAMVPTIAATVIMMVARVWDAVNDPMMGVICDGTKSKEGKSRFWLRRICVPAGICAALTYICPGLPKTALVIWLGITYILQGMAQTAVSISANTLKVSMTRDRVQRVRLEQYVAIVALIPSIIIPSVTLPFVRLFGSESYRTGFAVLAIIIGIAYALAIRCIYKATEGLDPDTSGKIEAAEEKEASVRPVELILTALKNKYCLLVCGAYMTYLLLSGLMGSTLVYYFTYNLQNTGLMSTYSVCVMIGAVAAILIMRILSRRMGNAITCAAGAALCIAGLLPRILTGDSVLAAFVIGLIILGVGSGLVSSMTVQCVMDATIYDSFYHGVDNKAIIMSLFTFSQKLGQAISSVVAAALLTAFHYTAGETPGDTILALFRFENLYAPMIIAVVYLALMLCVSRMEKKMVRDMAAADGHLS